MFESAVFLCILGKRLAGYLAETTAGGLVVPNRSTAETAIAPAPPGTVTCEVLPETTLMHRQVFP